MGGTMDNDKKLEIVPGHVGYSPDYKSDKRPKGEGFLGERILEAQKTLLANEPGAPLDDEIVRMVAGLKRSLSKRDMRYVIQELSRELGQAVG